MELSIRNIAAWFLSNFYLISGKINQVKKSAKNGEILLSVYFHNPSKRLFEGCVKWFLKNGFSIISTDELLSIIKNNKKLPASSVIFTVDDGWKENKANIVAVAEAYKIPITIFVTTSPVETGESYWWTYVKKAFDKKLTKHSVGALKLIPNEQRMQELERIKPLVSNNRDALTLEELITISRSPYITIGSHTVSHPILTMCNVEKSHYEIQESKKILEKWTGKPINFFAYPNGNYSEIEINALKLNDFEMAFTTKPEYISSNSFKSPFEIPRFDVLENVSFAENIIRMTGVWFAHKETNNNQTA
jgi:peptidoglycan/xylan/chitin deacetylase (PgdA/CDA1 family)